MWNLLNIAESGVKHHKSNHILCIQIIMWNLLNIAESGVKHHKSNHILCIQFIMWNLLNIAESGVKHHKSDQNQIKSSVFSLLCGIVEKIYNLNRIGGARFECGE
jgi:hypothetical protein